MAKTINQIGRKQCRFVVAEKPEMLFCGAPTRDKRSNYCKEHHHQIYTEGTAMNERRLYGSVKWIK